MANSDLSRLLVNALRTQGGVATSADLQEVLGVSQPTVSRALAPLVLAGEVRQTGAARRRRYLLPRQITGVGSDLPVMRVDASGKVTSFGRIVPLPGGRVRRRERDAPGIALVS